MALFNREKRVEERPVEREVVDERPADRHRYTRGVTRGLFTLLGAAAAIFLVWLAGEWIGFLREPAVHRDRPR